MPTFEETTINASVASGNAGDRRESMLSLFLGVLCSVRLGIILLILLGLMCLVGMLVMQQNVNGFERYFAELPPAQRLIYRELGFFDIYHAWYFNTLLAILSINIILASIDRFPATWRYFSKPKLHVTQKWLGGQEPSISLSLQGKKTEIISNITNSFKKANWKRFYVSKKNGRTVIFSETGLWNRFGAYAVHMGLLTIFLGGFLSAQFGHAGQMPLSPGQSSKQISELAFDLDQMKQVNETLPFEVFCTDIQQKLVKNDGPISSGNTIDWLTTIQIKDQTGTHKAVVQMNSPHDYRGYRFFQSSYVSVGRARTITLRATDETGKTQDLVVKRDGLAKLANGTTIKFADFRSNFSIGKENPGLDTSSYTNPAAILKVSPTDGSAQTAYAFQTQMADIPIAENFVGGYKFQLLDFEKVSEQHILSVQRDPGSSVVYVGFTLLFLTLVAVFFFSHQRVWAVIEESSKNQFEVVIGGNTNRNQTALEAKFNRIVRNLSAHKSESE